MKTKHLLSESDYQSLAAEYAGNWAKFKCFAWFDKPDNADQFCIVYVSNRDSDILDRANAQVIQAELAPYIARGTVRAESHSHWAVGYVEGYAIRVYTKRGRITKAFKVWCELKAQMDDYPILDESVYSELELEAQNESWELWARADFIRAIERALDVEIDSAADVSELFQAACDRSNTYWDGNSIDVERAASVVTLDDVSALVAGGAE